MQDPLPGRSAALITNPSNIRYLTGFSVGADAFEAALLVYGRDTVLITHVMNRQQAEAIAGRSKRVSVEIVTSMHDVPSVIGSWLTRNGIGELGFEPDDLSVSLHGAIASALPKDVRLVPVPEPVEKRRAVKSPAELALIGKACTITDACFRHIVPRLIPGVTEGQIGWEIESYLRLNGARNAFAPIVAFGSHSSIPHYVSTTSTTALAANDCVLLDFGARWEGYCADLSRSLAIGTPPDGWEDAFRTVYASQQAALEYLRTEKVPSGKRADEIAREVITDAGYPPYPHSLGHNLGLDIHESPRLTVRKDASLVPGMVFSVEPGIYLDGRFGIRIEDTVVKTATGIRILTTADRTVSVIR